MALADHFDDASALSSLSWVSLPTNVRIIKFAVAYLEKEDFIIKHSRDYYAPTKNTVKLLIRSLYVPVRGTISMTVDQTLAAIQRIKAVRTERAKNRPYVRKQLNLTTRRNAAAKRRFRIRRRDEYSKTEKWAKVSHNCVGITEIAGCLMIVDGGTYNSKPRIYLRSKTTGAERVIVLNGDRPSNIVSALLLLCPVAPLRAMFDGNPIKLDIEGEGFTVGGKLVPWANVRKIYRGSSCRQTLGEPKQQTQ